MKFYIQHPNILFLEFSHTVVNFATETRRVLYTTYYTDAFFKSPVCYGYLHKYICVCIKLHLNASAFLQIT